MDPNETLRIMLDRAAKVINESNKEEHDISFIDNAQELAESVEALNDWLSKGGFLPSKWAR